MTQNEFDSYIIGVIYQHAQMTKELMYKIRSGKHYNEIRKDIKKILLLTTYTDILREHTLLKSGATNTNFFTASEMQNLALKINYLTGLRFNYDFILNENI